MALVQSSPAEAPLYSLHRKQVSVIDTAFPTDVRLGCNASMYRWVDVQVVAYDNAQTDIEVWFWSPGAAQFIRPHTAIAQNALAVNDSYGVRVAVYGRLFYVAVTGLVTGYANIWVSGYGRNPEMLR